MLRSYVKHGVHKGDITSYDDEGELTFRVEYADGDVEDLSEVDVRATLTGSDEQSQPTSVSASVVARATPSTSLRKRSTPSVRQRSESTLWVPSTCSVSISVHFNAIDRGLCAQILREHHTVLERAMARLYPRFKWGRSHYLQVWSLLAIHA